MKDWDNAARTCSKIGRNNPFNYKAMYFTGVSYFNLGLFLKSEKFLVKASKLPPSFSSSKRYLLSYVSREVDLKEIEESSKKKKKTKKSKLSKENKFKKKMESEKALAAALLRKSFYNK